MKTRRQKVVLKYIRKYIAILACILLCASFFVMPVSAEIDELNSVTIENVDYVFGGDIIAGQNPHPSVRAGFIRKSINMDQQTSFSPLFTEPYPYNYKYGMGFEFDFPSDSDGDTLRIVSYINQLFDDNVYRTFSKNDTFVMAKGWFALYFGTDTTITDFRFTIRNNGNNGRFEWGAVVASTDVVSVNINDEFPEIEYDALTFKFTDDVYSNSLCLCLELTGTTEDNHLIIGVEPNEYTFKYGSGVSPNYPIYPSAPGGNVGNLENQESELIQGSQEGIDQAQNYFTNFASSLTSFQLVFTRLSSIMTYLTGAIPLFDILIVISLSLGLYASLVGLAGAIVSAADRKVGREKREAERAERAARRSKKGG